MVRFTHDLLEIALCCDRDTGIPVMPRTETKHPLDPLSAAEISVAVATVRAAGANPEVRFIGKALFCSEKTFLNQM